MTPAESARTPEIRFVVRDLTRSVRFYREALGLDCRESVPRGSRRRTSSLRLADGRQLVLCTPSPGAPASSCSTITIEMPTAEAVISSHRMASMLGGGGGSPMRTNGLWTATVLDPDGHVLRLLEPSPAREGPAWRRNAPGRRRRVPRSP